MAPVSTNATQSTTKGGWGLVKSRIKQYENVGHKNVASSTTQVINGNNIVGTGHVKVSELLKLCFFADHIIVNY